MPYAVSIANQATRDLVVESLRTAADQRVRVARKASADVHAQRLEGKDVRSQAVKLIGLLAEADQLTALADELATTDDLPIVSDHKREPWPVVDLTRLDDPTPLDVAAGNVGASEDDGTSEEAQAAAALAGLTPADPDAVEDELGLLPEDAPDEAEEVLTR